MAGKDKEPKKATSMFGKDGFSAWLKILTKLRYAMSRRKINPSMPSPTR